MNACGLLGDIMSKKWNVRSAVMAACLAAFGASNVAHAIYEVDSNDSRNDSIATAQPLEIGDGGSVEVTAILGAISGPFVHDVDFFSFQGTAGDIVTIDIDGGMKPAGSATNSLNSIVAIFNPDGTLLLQNNQAPVDSGSISFEDARIEPVVLPTSGLYHVGVSSFPHFFLDGGADMMPGAGQFSNGSYSLIISGVTPAPSVEHMVIEVKPGNRQRAAFNPKSKGTLPVALMSSPKFNPMEVDQQSVTFGATGHEASLRRCHKEKDLNDDGMPDLVCHFDTEAAGFGPENLSAFIKGKFKGKKFEGHGDLKIVPSVR